MEKEKLNLMSSIFHFMYLQRAETNIVYVQAPSFLLLVQIWQILYPINQTVVDWWVFADIEYAAQSLLYLSLNEMFRIKIKVFF